MAYGAGTVSKILWHFTGGPKWNSELNRQCEDKKPAEEAYRALNGILDTKTLRCSDYSESVKGIVSKKLVEKSASSSRVSHSNAPVELLTNKVCCVADIPIQHLKYHSMRYGEFAIGFHRDAVLKAGFNPVLYSLENSLLTKEIFKISEALSIDLQGELEERFRIQIFNFPDLYENKDQIFRLLSACAGGLVWDSHELAGLYFKSLATFVKTFKKDEFQSIYCEREWRSSNDFQFNLDSVAMIILPSKGDINYYEHFINTLPDNFPRRIPIVPWEDLIEH